MTGVMHVVQETEPVALIAPPVVQVVLWTRVSGAALVLPTLRFPAVDVTAVLSYFCHVVRGASALWMRVQSLANSRFRCSGQRDRDARRKVTETSLLSALKGVEGMRHEPQ